jgi:TolB protein
MSLVSFGRVNLIKVALLAIAVTLAACLVAFVGTTRPAGATFPGSNGKILFTKDGVGGAQDIYVMNADGTGQVNLTNSPENDAEPDWSPHRWGIYVTCFRSAVAYPYCGRPAVR